MTPFFSVIIPTYNRGHLIGKTLESVLNQTVSDFEILIVDDGSNDNTAETVRQFTDPRIHYLKKENGERGAARNYGTSHAKGAYINFFDSDDLMYPNHLRVAREFIESRTNPELFHLGYDFKTPDGEITKIINNLDEHLKDQVLFDNILSCNGVFVRKDIADTHPFEENRIMASAEDWELWIRLISRFPILYANDVTTSVVSHDQRSIFTISADKIVARDLLMIRNLRSDPKVMNLYGSRFRKFVAQRYSFFMLCLIEQKRYGDMLKWAYKAFATYPGVLLTRRYLVSMKKIVLK